MNKNNKLVLAIDGPAGAGKSTIAKMLANKLKYIYIDTGAMYRALTLKALNKGINLKSKEELANLVQNTEINLKKVDKKDKVFLDSKDVSKDIRKNKVSNYVSVVAKYKVVRDKLLKLQRQMANKGGVVMDGRDIGTVVLPNADIKIFLTASVNERAKRRYQELKEQEKNINFEQIKKEIIKRDEQDRNRKIPPLKKANDAIEIDSSNLSKKEVVTKIISIFQNKK